MAIPPQLLCREATYAGGGIPGRGGACGREVPCPAPGPTKFRGRACKTACPHSRAKFSQRGDFETPGTCRVGVARNGDTPAAALPGSYVRGRGHTGTRRRMRAGGLAPPPARKSFREGRTRPHAPSYAKKFPPSGAALLPGADRPASAAPSRPQQAREALGRPQGTAAHLPSTPSGRA